MTADVAPRVAPGVELMGRYDGSGLVEPSYLVRTRDGRVLAVSPLLYFLLARIDGRRDAGALARVLSADTGRQVAVSDVRYLVEQKLTPLGVLAGGAGAQDPTPHAPGRRLLGLSVRKAVIPGHAVERASALAAPLFTPGVVVVVLAAFVAMDAWLMFGPSPGIGLSGVIGRPPLVVLVLALTLVSGAFHELGHGAAASYGGARPGAVGVGVYLVWPAFFSDMTDSYRLSRASRIRVDLGGVYFNVVFMLLLLGAYGGTGQKALLVAIGVQHVLACKQFLPFLRFDGYYLACDLTGVPDLFGRMRPVLRQLARGRLGGATDLKPGIRALVTTWVLVTAGLMAGTLGLLAFHLPQALAKGAVFANRQATDVAALMRTGDVRGLLGLLRLAILTIPVAGLTLPFVQLLVSRRPSRALTRPAWWAPPIDPGSDRLPRR